MAASENKNGADAPVAMSGRHEVDMAFETILDTLRKLEQAQRVAAEEAQSGPAARRHEALAMGMAAAYDIVMRLKGSNRHDWVISLAREMSGSPSALTHHLGAPPPR
ncbi:hypothetical protein DWU98_06480 [Dyella monticola]|uniref:Uncharacterized protein n=1 Tax=Dyella monticola TaxID=1927958 RepID=A0A370X303_9GAMM|nr:hypothetical protein [Dyella monticola]RDS82793.1 hypothetical protein DWU98_06480 [Dyella monticola]